MGLSCHLFILNQTRFTAPTGTGLVFLCKGIDLFIKNYLHRKTFSLQDSKI